MDQKIFSESVYNFLEINFAEFLPTIIYQTDGSFDCTLKNPTNRFSIWLATYNCEITIGLETPDGSSDLHSHIPCYTPEDLDNCLSQLSDFIDDIKNERTILYRRANGHYDWVDYAEFLDEYDAERFFWN